METTEKGKGMKIVVTRAPRIKKRLYPEVPEGHFYLAYHDADDQYLIMQSRDNRWVNRCYKLPYALNLAKNVVVPLGNFDDMCRWVSNGCKLEDLEGDGKDEWVTIHNLPDGIPAVIMECHTGKWVGVVVMKALTAAKALISIQDGARFVGDEYCSVMASNMMVWPIGAGDTITITWG